MKKHLEEEAELRRYLLGDLTQDEHVSIEARLFLDDQYLLQLQALEDELIDDYVYNELPATERQKLEIHFLSKPGRDEDLKIAQALKRYGDLKAEHTVSSIEPDLVPAPPLQKTRKLLFLSYLFNRKPFLSISLTAASLVILSFIVWPALNFMIRRNQAEPLRAQSPTLDSSEPTAERPSPTGDADKVPAEKDTSDREGHPARQQGSASNRGKQIAERTGPQESQPRDASPTPERPPSRSLAFLLLPGGDVRGEGRSKTLPLPPDVGSVVLQLPLVEGDNYDTYKASLHSGARTIRVWPELKSSTAETITFVPVTVPTKLLHRQSYQIKLAGITTDRLPREINTYTFKVTKQ